MFIKELKLVNFRSYSALKLDPGRYVNVLTGNNAEGKTNVVEAIFLCALFRSHRTRLDQELIKWESDGAYACIKVQSRLGERQIEITLPKGSKRRIKLDSNYVSRMAEAMGTLNVVMFAPEDLNIIKGAPEMRRRFIDMEMSQLSPAYFALLQSYYKALAQRNAVLRRLEGRGGDVHIMPKDWEDIKIWDEQVILRGAKVMKERAGFVRRLNEEAQRVHALISGGAETLEVTYAPNVTVTRDAEPSYRHALKEGLRNTMCEEFRKRYTVVGPHKDDVLIKINGESTRVYGSQGQQRTAALALKLSEIELMREVRKETPIVILDDVLSELDESRQKMILAGIGDAQVFVTCTSLGEMKNAFAGEMKVFKVKDASVSDEADAQA